MGQQKDRLISDSKEKANVLNEQFKSVSQLNYNVIKCLSAELIIFLIKKSNY